jgi:hypothetical protein
MGTFAVSVALIGCGGAGAKHGEAAKPARQIAADAVAAAEHLHSFRLAGTITDAGGTTRSGGRAGTDQLLRAAWF